MTQLEPGIDLDAPIAINVRKTYYQFPSFLEMGNSITQYMVYKLQAGTNQIARRRRKGLVRLFDTACVGVRDFDFASQSELNKWIKSVPKDDKICACFVFDDDLDCKITYGLEALVEIGTGFGEVVFHFPNPRTDPSIARQILSLKLRLASSLRSEKRLNLVKMFGELRGAFAQWCLSVDGVDLLMAEGWHAKIPSNWVYLSMLLLAEENAADGK